ncbi:peptidoglycan DD-metalloendopeptidase family protein [Virgibacillus ndiopensis]|uniref:peptidoglycan DD-metalloendopeptidase family protein n=1 Tax=Virgibacillus ndiopensis TaxID=2004408 RepID=UPI000C080112|nr:M23 family metallopeptidase [Virgibacillus ndiopensis]
MLEGNQKGKRKRLSLLKKTAITTCLGLSLTFTTVYADESAELETIYHVYVDGEHIGKIDDKAVVENIMDGKVTTGQKKFDKFEMTIGENVSFVPEKVFNPTYNNSKVSDILKNELSVKAKAVELKIADETVGYFKDQETADAALKAYKAKYVDQKKLEKLEAKKSEQKQSQEKTNPSEAKTNPSEAKTNLSVGDSILLDLTLSEKVSFSEQKVLPKDIVTVKEGVKLLEKGTLKEKVHKVQDGDVLGGIASQYDLSLDKLLELNPSLDEDSLLQLDQEINVTEYKPFVDVIVKEEKKVEETIKHETEIIESDELYKGETNVKQEGKEGKQIVHYAIEKQNGKVTSKEAIDKKVTNEPVKKIIIKGTKVIPSRGSGNLHWPTIGGYVSSNVGVRWGRMHKGMDIARPSNRAILAADNGVVVEAGRDGSFGNKIVINHNNGMKTIYAHLSSIGVQVGQTVERGSQIGVMGATGNSTGVHLHFEVHVNGSLQNPQKYF